MKGGTNDGSSPLTRGKRRLRQVPAGRARLIPAHAGKTSTRRIGWIAGAAHPRSRGENRRAHSSAVSVSGSSPLTRGKRLNRGRSHTLLRLIPAHAGKTPRQKRSPRGGRAHPRSRGENNHVGGPADYELGSSPLTRGKPGRGPLCLPTRRLIPAHAGKTSWKPTRRRPSAAHPRSRGENPMRSRTLAAASGSSPLTRGKRLHQDPFVMTVRLIPAHAGKTSTAVSTMTVPGAHPRSRGENGRL